ncbi:MAG: EcnA/B family entericidin [Roseobacter sp.]
MTRIAVLLSLVLALAACETTKGLGRDVTSAGEALDEAI